MSGELLSQLRKYSHQIRTSLHWIVLAVLTGVIIGFVGTAFFYLMGRATQLRLAHPVLIFFLPAAGLVIVGLYHFFHDEKDTGTNLVLSAVHSGEKLPVQMAPLIFVSTILTHLFGGSAGREGAALQIGGSIANSLGALFRMDEKKRNILIMCGMSAGFSAIFGTPIAATVFCIEVVSVGIIQYAALVPCAISALVSHGIASYFLDQSLGLEVLGIPEFGLVVGLKTALLAVICAFVSIFFCIMLHKSEEFYRRFFKNPFLRVVVGGGIVIAITMLTGSQDYNGLSAGLLHNSFSGNVVPWAFLLKMLLTAATLGAGFKGGEIVPSFVIGASLGSTFGSLAGMSPSLCAAIGMGAVFCGVTNSPIASFLICVELFGFGGMPYYLLAIALSYMFSGYYGLYSSQKIAFSKYRTEYINKKMTEL